MLDVPSGNAGCPPGEKGWQGWVWLALGRVGDKSSPCCPPPNQSGHHGRESWQAELWDRAGRTQPAFLPGGGGLLRDTLRLLPLQAEGGLCKFLLQPEPRAGESRAQPWQVVGRGPAAPSLLVGPVFHQADLTWELRRFGARPSEQLGALLRASPFSTRWCWIKSCPEGHGVQTSKKFLLHLSVTIGTGSRTVTISIFLTRETVYSNVQICAAWHLRGPRDVIN